jgi:hypothetical protein
MQEIAGLRSSRLISQVDVEFKSRVKHPVTLALLKLLAGSTDLPDSLSYIGEQGFKAITEMALVNRGRLSERKAMHRMNMQLTWSSCLLGVQPVTREAYDAILLLGEKGGWDDLMPAGKKSTKRKSTVEADKGEEENPVKRTGRGREAKATEGQDTAPTAAEKATRPVKKRKATAKVQQEDVPESDLSDLPSSDLSEAEQSTHSSVLSKNEDSKTSGKTPPHGHPGNGQPAIAGTRRSARQRTTKAEW